MGASTASVAMTVASHNGSNFGVVTSFALLDKNTAIPLRDLGAKRVTAFALILKDLSAQVSYIGSHTMGVLAAGTKGSLVLTYRDLANGAHSWTIANMFAMDTTVTGQQYGNVQVTTTFECEDAADSTTLAQT